VNCLLARNLDRALGGASGHLPGDRLLERCVLGVALHRLDTLEIEVRDRIEKRLERPGGDSANTRRPCGGSGKEIEERVVDAPQIAGIDAYCEASMDLRSVKPELNLYNRQWPLRTACSHDPPAKFTFDEETRRSTSVDSIIADGANLASGTVKNCIIGRGVKVHTGAVVENSVLFDSCDIGRHAKVRRAILDKDVRVLEGAQIG
jgi:hypothetical protein